MTFFFSSDYNPHTDRSTFYNSAQSTWGQVRPRQTLLQRVPPFIFYFFKETYKTGRAQRVPPLSFLIFCNVRFVNKSRRVPPFTFFGTMRLLLKEKFFFKNFNFFPKKVFYAFWALDMAPTLDVLVLFLFFFRLQSSHWSVHFLQSWILSRAPEAKSAQGKLYSKGSPLSFFYFFKKTYKTGRAQRVPPLDFFRHCATFFRKFFNVPKGSPLWVFWYFATECLLINPEGSPFYIFRHYETSFERNFFFKNFNFFPKKMFYAFWALDKAPTLDVLVLFFSSDYNPHTDWSTF